MTVLVVQSTAGTSALNGTAPDPTNVPGNNWVASSANVTRRSSGGIWMPSTALDYQLLSYDLATARQKIYVTNITTLDGDIYVRALLNKDASGSAPYGTGTCYALIIRAGFSVSINSCSGGGVTTLATASGSVPATPFTISQLTFEHLTSGALNASVTIGATTYTATASVGSPLTGTWLGFANTTGASGGMSAGLVQFENEVIYSTRITWAEAQYQASGAPVTSTDYSEPLSRGIFRGIERGVA